MDPKTLTYFCGKALILMIHTYVYIHHHRVKPFHKHVSDPANFIHFSFLFIFLTAASEVIKGVLNDCDGDRR
jgi:hypothetical protein